MVSARFLVVGDLHLMATNPKCRLDDIMEVQIKKLNFIRQTAEEYQPDAIIFPGDVFDKANAPYGLIVWAIEKFRNIARANNSFMLFVFGQHDLPYHRSTYNNTPLGLLIKAIQNNHAYVLDNEKPLILNSGWPRFWGASWGKEIKEKLNYEDAVVMHRLIVPAPMPFDGPIEAKDLFKKHKAGLFVCGDNHKRFTAIDDQSAKGKRYIVNMGSVIRKTKDQTEHEPAMALVVYENKEFHIRKNIKFPIEAADQIFDERGEIAAAPDDERIRELVQEMQNGYNISEDFTERLAAVAKAKAGKMISNFIYELLAELGKGNTNVKR